MGKKTTRAAKAYSNFVADQMHAIGVAECAHPLQILRVMHRHACCTLHERFDDDGSNFAVTGDEQLLQRIGGTIRHADGAFAWFGEAGVRRRGQVNMLTANERCVGIAEQWNISHGQGADCFAVITALQADKFAFVGTPLVLPGMQRHLEGNLRGARTIRGKESVAQSPTGFA